MGYSRWTWMLSGALVLSGRSVEAQGVKQDAKAEATVGALQRALAQVPKLKLPFELPARGRLLSLDEARVLVLEPGNRADSFELVSLAGPEHANSVEALGQLELPGGATALVIRTEPLDEKWLEVQYRLLTYSPRGLLVDTETLARGVKAGEASPRTETVILSRDGRILHHVVQETELGGTWPLPPTVSVSFERVLRIRPDATVERGPARFTSPDGAYFGLQGLFVVWEGDWAKPHLLSSNPGEAPAWLKVLKVDAARRSLDVQGPGATKASQLVLDEAMRNLTRVNPDGTKVLLSRPMP